MGTMIAALKNPKSLQATASASFSVNPLILSSTQLNGDTFSIVWSAKPLKIAVQDLRKTQVVVKVPTTVKYSHTKTATKTDERTT